MRGKTRNLIENVGAFVFLIILLSVIFLVVANYTSLGKALELEAIKNTILENFKDKTDKNSSIIDNTNIILEKENKEQNISKEKIAKKEVTKVNTKEESKKIVVEKTEEKKVALPKFPVKINEEKPKVQESKKTVNTKKEEAKKIQETEKEQSDQKKSGPVLSAKNLAKFSVINKFIRDTKTKINNNIKKQNIPKAENPRYANIRVTVLKNGGYEQLILMDGNKEYFNLIKEGVLSSFPLKIDPKINDQFPRYFRMKIIEK